MDNKKKSPPRQKKKGPITRVKMLDTGLQGQVEEILSSQMTVAYTDGTFGFVRNKDEGVTWEPIEWAQLRSPKPGYVTFASAAVDSWDTRDDLGP